MPSEYAKEIVDRIFSNSKQDALDSVNDALASKTMDLIQAKKLEFARSMGFDLDQTGQEAADELELPDGTDGPVDYEIDGRMPHDPPEEDEVEIETTEETPETEEDYEDETYQ
jgi:hypothetical protein